MVTTTTGFARRSGVAAGDRDEGVGEPAFVGFGVVAAEGRGPFGMRGSPRRVGGLHQTVAELFAFERGQHGPDPDAAVLGRKNRTERASRLLGGERLRVVRQLEPCDRTAQPVGILAGRTLEQCRGAWLIGDGCEHAEVLERHVAPPERVERRRELLGDRRAPQQVASRTRPDPGRRADRRRGVSPARSERGAQPQRRGVALAAQALDLPQPVEHIGPRPIVGRHHRDLDPRPHRTPTHPPIMTGGYDKKRAGCSLRLVGAPETPRLSVSVRFEAVTRADAAIAVVAQRCAGTFQFDGGLATRVFGPLSIAWAVGSWPGTGDIHQRRVLATRKLSNHSRIQHGADARSPSLDSTSVSQPALTRPSSAHRQLDVHQGPPDDPARDGNPARTGARPATSSVVSPRAPDRWTLMASSLRCAPLPPKPRCHLPTNHDPAR